MTEPRQLFVTGCYRSGTTLTEKLLHAHPDMCVASQPFPVLLFAAKEHFLAHLGIERRYPIDPQFDESDYTPEDFSEFLAEWTLSREVLEDVARRLAEYEVGLWTKEVLDIVPRIQPGGFSDVWEQLTIQLAGALGKPGASVVGSKEILGEEFLATVTARGGSGVLVIRDPRDVITSLNIPDRDNLTGDPRPVLYSIRLWRKSVAYALTSGDRVAVIRYEDLVQDPVGVMGSVASTIGLPLPTAEVLSGGLVDQSGDAWTGNSSFDGFSGVSTDSVGRYRDRLPDEVTAYVEMLTAPEMRIMGYETETSALPSRRFLERFVEPTAAIHGAFEPGYSSDRSRIEQEVHRMELLQSGADSATAQRWFISPAAFARLASSEAEKG